MTQEAFYYRSFAKINLYLEINAKREDGFHELKSVFQTVELHDELIFSRTDGDILLQVECPFDDQRIHRDNIVCRTAREMKKIWNIKEGAAIHVRKKIPIGSGLGGGSSNSSVTIKALNKLWNLRLSREDILSISTRQGSDVPFFSFGGTVLVEGRGEKLLPLRDVNPVSVIIVKPEFSISTADAYRWWDEAMEWKRVKRPFGSFDLDGGNFEKVEDLLHNDFEEVLFPRYPLLRRIKDALLEMGCRGALLSGSGSCIFGVADTFNLAQQISEKVRELSIGSVFLTRTLGREEFCMM